MSPLSPFTWTAAARQRLFVLGVVLLFVGLGVQYSLKAVEHRSAILRWREQIQQLDSGENIYDRYIYPNPPIMALILKPITELPPLAGALLWFCLKVGMTLVALLWVFRMIETPERPFPPWAKALTVLLSLRPIMGDLSHGNVNLLILFLVVGAAYAYSRGRDLLSGTTVALAIACKVTPALMVPYFVWKRAWKALAGCAVGLVLFFWVVPGCFLGFAQNEQLLSSWVAQMVKPYLLDGVVTSEHNNQSLPGLVQRLATHSPSFSTYVNDVYTPVTYHNLFDWQPAHARLFVKACMLAFVGVVVWTCRTPTVRRHGWRQAAEFSVVFLGMLLFSERTWKHHCVTLLLPFAVLSYYLALPGLTRACRMNVAATLASVALLMAATSTSLLDSLDGAAKLAQVYGAYVWACLLLLIALAGILRRADPLALGEAINLPGPGEAPTHEVLLASGHGSGTASRRAG